MKFMDWFKPNVKEVIFEEDFKYAKEACKLLTKDQFEALCKVVKSEVYYPGLRQYFYITIENNFE